ncbi:hypothetical protein ACFLVS_02060 [Chloroflexota bacterium]
MGKGNDIYDEMDKINHRIREIKNKYPSVSWVGEGEKIQAKNIPLKERQELEQLLARLKQLKEQDDKDQTGRHQT